MIENERIGILQQEIQSSISSIIPIRNERQEHNILTSHQSRIKNVPLSILFMSVPTQRTTSRMQERQRENKKRRRKKRDNLRVNFVDAIKTIG